MKGKKTIIIIAAAVVLAAVAVVAIIGAASGWFDGEEKLTVSQVFDESGEVVIREDYYNKDDVLQYRVVKSYNEETKLLSQERYIDAEDKLMKVVQYDKEGKISGVDEYEGVNVAVVREYENGEETGAYTQNKYNEAGVLTETVKYDVNGEVEQTVRREYNESGAITLYAELDKDGKEKGKTVYEYNEKGLESKVTFYKNGNITGYVTKEYNEKNQCVKMSEFIDGKLNNYRTYTYDESGMAKEEYHTVEE